MPDIGASVDRYVVEAVLGEGGMGRVYRALDPRLNRRVALKVLLADGLDPRGQTEGRARMLREARAAAAFNHPNVVAIYDVGEVDGSPYIAMELVRGSTLRAYVGDPDVAVEAKVAWLVDVARGLGAAHRAGLVHRDIKPDNVMVTEDGVVKILDFGIARRSDAVVASDGAAIAGLPNVTPANAVIGTPQYMAPEQIRGEPLDGRADQFAWAVMAYEVLGGKIPWTNAGGLAVVSSVLSDEAKPLRELVPLMDPRVDPVIARALAKSADQRFATMEALVVALEGKRALVPQPSGEDVAFAATTAQPVVAIPPGPAKSSEPSVSTRSGTTPMTSRPLPRRGGSWRLAMGVVAACGLSIGGLSLWRAAHMSKVAYCVTLEETRDGPRCGSQVAREVAARRYHSTAHVITVGRLVSAVEYANFAGRRLPRESDFDDDDDSRRDVVRGAEGHVRQVVMRDANGVVESDERWSEDGARVDLVDVDGTTPRHASSNERYTSIRRAFDATGRLVRAQYFGPTGRPRANRDGVYGSVIEYGKTPGARVKVTLLGADGQPAAQRNGVAITRSTDDEVPDGRESSRYGVDDLPVADNGVHREVQVWDGVDVTHAAVFGVHGEPAFGFPASVHEIRSTFDPVAHVEVFSFFDDKGKARASRDRWFSAVRFTQDALGRDLLIQSLDAAGNLTLVKDGVAQVRCEYDDRSNEIRRDHLDPSGAPMVGGAEGYAQATFKRDAHGNAIEERFFDDHGQPAPVRDGTAIRRTVWDERDLPIGVSSFDVNDRPVSNVSGWASKRSKYDRMRNLVEEAYFGANGKPTVNTDGVAAQKWTYDADDDLVSVAYFDTAGVPTMFLGEYASKQEAHDERGQLVVETYLDVHGEPVLQADGYASVKRARDRNGDVVLESFMGGRGEPVLREGGYAARKTTYDIHRRPVEVTLLDASGVPVVGAEGWATERSVYDDRGLLVRVDHLDPAGGPVKDRLGRASVAKVYDARLNVIEESNLGADGRPVATGAGWATKKTVYDDRDEVSEESLFGPSGEPVVGSGGWALHRERHDDFGDVVEEAFFDAAHRATPLRDATYASERSRYDERRGLAEIAYFDAAGAPAKGPDGAAIVRYTRDAYQRAVETSYLDGAGVPTPSVEGTTTVRTRYDDARRPVEELFVDGAGTAQVALDGCAGHRMRYDPQGHEVERTCVGPGAAIAVGAEGWASRRMLHDARGNVVEEETYDAAGAPRADRNGVAQTKRSYDDRDRILEVAVFGVDGKPTHDRQGVHVTRYAYGEGRRQTSESTFDERGRAVSPPKAR